MCLNLDRYNHKEREQGVLEYSVSSFFFTLPKLNFVFFVDFVEFRNSKIEMPNLVIIYKLKKKTSEKLLAMIVILSPKFLNIGQNVSSNTLVVENENKQKEKKSKKSNSVKLKEA